jgi:hypothetical protein
MFSAVGFFNEADTLESNSILTHEAFIDGTTSRLKVNDIKIALIKAYHENWNWLHKCLWQLPKVEDSDPATVN